MQAVPPRRRVLFEGVTHDFPGDATDAETAAALNEAYPLPKPAAPNQGQANPFDQFDQPQANPFDQFDVPAAQAVPPPPPGFVLQSQEAPPPPSGFVIDAAAAPQPPAQSVGGPQIPGRDVWLTAEGKIGGPAHQGVPVAPDAPRTEDLLPDWLIGDDPLRGLQIGTQGVGRGVADLAGAPFDLSNLLANLGLNAADLLSTAAGGDGVDYRIRGSVADTIADAGARVAETAGVDLIGEDGMSARERLGYNIDRFGSQALLGGSALASAPVQAATRTSGGFTKAVTRPYRESPSAVVGDTAAGAGAGSALSGYEEYVPEPIKEQLGPLGKVLAMLGGGIGGVSLLGAGRTVGRAGASAGQRVAGVTDPNAPINPSTGRPYSRGEMDMAARAVQRQASNPGTARLNIRDTQSELSEFASAGEVPTTGILSDDVGLSLLERQARARNAAPFLERDRAVTSRAGDLVGSTAPAGSEPRALTEAAESIQTERVDTARRRVGEAETAEAELETTRRAAGAELAANQGRGPTADLELDRAIVEDSLRPRQEAKNEAFRAIDPNRTVEIDAGDLIRSAREVRSSLGRLNDPATVLPLDTLNRIEALSPDAGGTGTITFGELNALRPQLAAAETRARSAAEYPLADNIRRLRAAVDSETSRLASQPSEAGRRAAEASRLYREDFAPVWNVGPGDEATQFRKQFNLDRAARTTTPPSQTASRFLQPGQPERTQSLQRIVASTPNPNAGRAAVRQHMISDLAGSGVVDAKTGALRPDMVRKWRDRWGATLDAVPEVRAEVEDLIGQATRGERLAGRMAEDVRKARESLTETQQNLGALGLVLGKDPTNAVAAVFKAGDPERSMGELLREIGGGARRQDALNGLKAATRDYILRRSTTSAVQRTADGARPVSFDQLDKIFRDSERVLAQVYSPKEMTAAGPQAS